MSIWIRVGGVPATEIAPHSPPTWETWADGGCGSASWEFALTPRAQHQALRLGAVVEVMCGGLALWSGLMSEPDRTSGECIAYGFAAEGRKYLALGGSLESTRDLEVALSWSIARGWGVTNPTPISGPVAGDSTGNPISVGQLLDEYAEQTAQRWGVDAQRRVYMTPGPTTPVWMASPDAAAFGVTSEDRANTIHGRYLQAGTGLYETATAGSGAPEIAADLTGRGELSEAAAVAILTGALARDHAGPAWTNGVTMTRDQLQTLGGVPAFLPAVQAGQMMRSFGLSYSDRAGPLDTVIGKTRYTAGEDVIYVEPVNTAPRSLTDVIAAA